eukprot:CAMPEP_0198223384 /NCGR_PEP_ID=MMETSP1445-20131203/92336_1 /TAXON_ID=36898 /ORGANISM="Pyramimonas sp., Strain CCMP2087" /LENGTH=52 /DNA_ID=CAMNT_0043902207 /DNA_START=449 /DNA_END=607 /DNA_ORIENTATION=+
MNVAAVPAPVRERVIRAAVEADAIKEEAAAGVGGIAADEAANLQVAVRDHVA